MPELQLSEKAADIFKQLITEEGNTTEDTYFLVGANSGGCSGYKFFLDTTHDITASDVTFEQHGVTMVVRRDHLEDIIGDVLIDYNEENLVSQGFEFKRLKYNVTCGCGESFTPVKDLRDGPKKLGW